MQDQTDQQLLEAARSGDTQALESLLDRHQAQIYRFGMKMCRDPHDAQDVLQDTLLSMARGVRDFRGESTISTWLYTIARRHCLKKRRTSKFAPEEIRSLESGVASEAAEVSDVTRGPEEALAARQVESALEEAIGGLEPTYREVLVLRDVEGLTAPEVAEVLGISVQAVKSRLHRARVAMRAKLAPLLGIPIDSAPDAACPDVLTLFSKRLEGEINNDVCEEMERHLASCDRCRGACDSLRRTLALCSTSASAVAVPASVQASVKNALRDFLNDKS